eukprot:gene8336-8521_t
MQSSAQAHEATGGQELHSPDQHEPRADGLHEAQQQKGQQQLHEAVTQALLKQAIINSNQRYLCRLLRSSKCLARAINTYCGGQLVARVKPTATSSFPIWLAQHSHIVGHISIIEERDSSAAADEATSAFNARLVAALQDATTAAFAQQQAGSGSSCRLSQLRSFECRTLPGGLLHHLSACHLTRLAFQDTEVPVGGSLGRFTALKQLKAASITQPIAQSQDQEEADRCQLMGSLTSLQQLTSLDLHIPPDDLWQLPARLQGQLQHLRSSFWDGGGLHLGPFTGLTALDMDSEGQVDVGDVLPPNLQRLDGVHYLNSVQPLLPLQQLRAINGVAQYAGTFIEACHQLPNLTSIRGCFASDPAVLRLPAGMVLEIDVTEDTATADGSADALDTWQRLGKLTAVTCLDVTRSVLTCHFLDALRNLKRLQKLVLTRPWHWRVVSSEGLGSQETAAAAAYHSGCSSNTAASLSRHLIEAASQLPGLQHLYLDDVCLNDSGCLGQLQKLTQLTALKLSGCSLPSGDQGVPALLGCLPLLQYLDLSHNAEIDDGLMPCVQQMLPRLVDLDLHGSGVAEIDEAVHDQLTRLRL